MLHSAPNNLSLPALGFASAAAAQMLFRFMHPGHVQIWRKLGQEIHLEECTEKDISKAVS
jgi:hypothetical protein